MAGRAVNLFSEKLKDSLPPSEDLWSSFSQKMNDTLHQASSLVGHTGEKLKESHPLVKRIVGFTEEGVSSSLPYVKRFVGFTKDKVIEAVPYVKSFVEFSVEKIKQHPYLFGLVVLIVLCKWKGWNLRKKPTMKAPGRNSRMFRADFEMSPRSYFQGLRGKKN